MNRAKVGLGALAGAAASCAMAIAALAEEPAPAKEPSARDCFNTRNISGYSAVDRDTIRLRIGVKKYYDLDVSRAGCLDLQYANRVALVGRPSNFICVGDPLPARIVTDRGERCLVTEVRRYIEPEKKDAEGESAASPQS